MFTGVSQIIDKNTVVSANLALGYNEGYLNDPYKIFQPNEVQSIPDGLGGTIDVPVVNIYPENRPDTRFRQVFQLEARRYFSQPDGVLEWRASSFVETWLERLLLRHRTRPGETLRAR